MVARNCRAETGKGEPCRQAPLQESEFCFWHSPDHTTEAAEARRLGGLRRRKEKAVSGAYDVEGLATVDQIRRLIEIAVLDTLSMENSIARSRTLGYLGQVALKVLEVGDFQERLQALEAAIGPRLRQPTGRRR